MTTAIERMHNARREMAEQRRKEKAEREARRQLVVTKAREQYADDDCEIDDSAATSEAEEGTWVAAWVWVAKEEIE